MRNRENQARHAEGVLHARRPQGYVAVTLAQGVRFMVTGFLMGVVTALLAVVELHP